MRQDRSPDMQHSFCRFRGGCHFYFLLHFYYLIRLAYCVGCSRYLKGSPCRRNRKAISEDGPYKTIIAGSKPWPQAKANATEERAPHWVNKSGYAT